MPRRRRRSTRSLPARKISSRAPGDLANDTEKLMSGSLGDSEDPDTEPARQHHQSHADQLPPVSQSAAHRDYSVHEIDDVPAPIPDTGLPPPSTNTTIVVSPSDLASQTTVASKPSSSHSHAASSMSTFVPLPYLKTANITEIEEAAARSSSVIRPTQTFQTAAVTTAGIDLPGRNPQMTTSHLSSTAIVGLAVGGGLTLFIVIILVKVINRPHRRRTPTPSLPILHDGTFSDDKVDSEGSPIFGGKECSSPTFQGRDASGSTGPWKWTQYNSGIPKPAPTVTVTRSSSQDQLTSQATQQERLGVTNNNATHAQGQDQGQYPFIGYGNPNAISKSSGPLPLQPVQNAITRAVSRLSTVSMSLYPNSPGEYLQVGSDVGLAIDGVTHSEPANVAVQKYKDRTATSRNRTSMIATPGSVKDAAGLRRSQSFAYGGMEPGSPLAASPSRGPLNGGRVRIRSTYYTPGSYPRTSAAAANYGKHDLDQEHDGIHIEQNRVQRTDSRRGRDLTSAPGLSSPIPPSPQPTLYPDDSMSVIGEAKKVTVTGTGRGQKKPIPKASLQCDSPPSDTAALGSLMMVDFAASKSTASLVNIRPCEAARAREAQGGACGAEGGTGKSNLKKRVEDKPPRVPSPPPIPSLAQMALQHADPEGYGDYHSPTYSIYGLYGGEGKSRVASYGC